MQQAYDRATEGQRAAPLKGRRTPLAACAALVLGLSADLPLIASPAQAQLFVAPAAASAPPNPPPAPLPAESPLIGAAITTAPVAPSSNASEREPVSARRPSQPPPEASFAPAGLPDHARVRFNEERDFATLTLPLGPWPQLGVHGALTLDGALSQTAWSLRAPEPDNPPNTARLSTQLRSALTAEGWQLRYDCAARACGGFDFRNALEIIPEPLMHVNLADFRALSFTRGPEDQPDEALLLLISRSSAAEHLQLSHLTRKDAPAPSSTAPPPPEPELPAFLAALMRDGQVVLEDLQFRSGSQDLSEASAATIEALALWLQANPERTIQLRGHTDNQGSLASNLAVSSARAEAVRQSLITEHHIAPERISAEGLAYREPRASNDSPEGRAQNRRVELRLR